MVEQNDVLMSVFRVQNTVVDKDAATQSSQLYFKARLTKIHERGFLVTFLKDMQRGDYGPI